MVADHVRDAGVWKPAKSLNGRDTGLWKPAKQGLIRDSAVWKPFFKAIPTKLGQQDVALAIPGSSSRTFSITVPAGCDCLVLAVTLGHGNGAASVTAATYGGTGMIKAVEGADGSAGNAAAIFFLLNPTVGTANIITSMSVSVNRSHGATALFLSNAAGIDVTANDNAAASGVLSAALTSTTPSLVLAVAKTISGGTVETGNFSVGVTKDRQSSHVSNSNNHSIMVGRIERDTGPYTMTFTSAFSGSSGALALAAFK